VVRAQVWPQPAARAVTPLPRPLTGVGVRRSVVVPSPSWPYQFPPQQRAAPAVVRAQVWGPPAARAATPLPRVGRERAGERGQPQGLPLRDGVRARGRAWG
jgi:hypothetical protein